MSAGAPVRVLLVDNYDSYTYNLYQLIGQVCGVAPVVVRHDALGPVAGIDREFTHIVVSPGPGHPQTARSIGRCRELISGTALPLLGVCLGHQAIATAFGGRVEAVRPRHGHVSTIEHDGLGVLAGLPQGLRVVRYHSLAVTAVPDELCVAAHAEDGTVMALRHRHRPLHGVQFHPESVATEHGRRLMINFLAPRSHDRNFNEVAPSGAARDRNFNEVAASGGACDRKFREVAASGGSPVCRLLVREAPWRDPEDVFVARYAGRPYVCWLDSADARPGQGRMSYLGAPEGPRAHLATYRLGTGRVRLWPGAGDAVPGDIFGFLTDRLRAAPVAPADAPFAFRGGYLGYLGYELKALCGGRRWHRAGTDDAAFLYVERFLAFDHDARRVYAAAVARPGEQRAAAQWLAEAVAAVRATRRAPAPGRGGRLSPIESTMDETGYAAAFQSVQRHLARGDSYEVNLTYRLRFTCTAEHADLYRHLRRANPAPHAAFLRVPRTSILSTSPERFLRIGARTSTGTPDGTGIVTPDGAGIVTPDGAGTGTSIGAATGRRIEARPIKGTLPRHPDPRTDEVLRRSLGKDPKTFAENLMIVDLLRNDLGQVCQLGSVEVPELMVVEPYATVHQLVSTVTGVLDPAVDSVAAVRAAFPAGSMTGAPKLRTMEIIDGLERDARGVYSGVLGYFSLSGEADFSVVIRTVVARGAAMSIGVGGGVVSLSRVRDEWAEAHLKSAVLLDAVRGACTREPGRDLPMPYTLSV